MRITVNGEELDLPDAATLADLVAQRDLADAACATEVNRRIVPKKDRDNRPLAEGDRVEIVTLVGGG